MDLKTELTELVNKRGLDDDYQTPDYILAEYLVDCLQAFGRARILTLKHEGRLNSGLLKRAS